MAMTDDAALLVGFMNTIHLPDGVETLAGSRPAEWIAAGRVDRGPLAVADNAKGRPGARVDDLRALREGIRVLIDSAGDMALDTTCGDWTTRDASAVAAASRVIGSVPLILDLASGAGRALLRPAVPAADDFEQDVAAVAAAYLSCATDGSLPRVKVCARLECRWAFFDASKNRSRRWCSMTGCGNVSKNRAYRTRRAAQ